MIDNESIKFDASKLETEYDCDTDQEQINNCKRFLEVDLYDAIDFFIKDDPIHLVENLNSRF